MVCYAQAGGLARGMEDAPVITKPSLGELFEAATATTEQVVLPALAGTSGVEPITSVLMVLDRIKAEWPLAACHLIEDNLDIELTLRRIGRDPGPPDGVANAAEPSPLTVDDLNDRNTRLKSALVSAMEAMDLPAPEARSDEVRTADREVRELLTRMLRREEAAMPSVAPRVNALSRGGSALSDEEVDRMTTALTGFLAAEMPDATGIAVREFTPLAGGASREAFLFDVAGTTTGRTTTRSACSCANRCPACWRATSRTPRSPDHGGFRTSSSR